MAETIARTRTQLAGSVLADAFEHLPRPEQIVSNEVTRSQTLVGRMKGRTVTLHAEHELAARVLTALQAVEALAPDRAQQRDALVRVCRTLSSVPYEIHTEGFPFWAAGGFVDFMHPAFNTTVVLPGDVLLELTTSRALEPFQRRIAARLYLWNELQFGRYRHTDLGESDRLRDVRRARMLEAATEPPNDLVRDEALLWALGSRWSARLDLHAVTLGALRAAERALPELPTEHAVWTLLNEVTHILKNSAVSIPCDTRPSLNVSMVDEITRWITHVMPRPRRFLQLGQPRAFLDPLLAASFERFARTERWGAAEARHTFTVGGGVDSDRLVVAELSDPHHPFWRQAAAVDVPEGAPELWNPPLDLLRRIEAARRPAAG